MSRTTYDFVCAIGHYCGTAMYMRRHCLRSTSGPFDWIGEDPGGLLNHVDIICRDFRDFLERDRLVALPNPHGKIDDLTHDYYRDEGTGLLTYHDFPSDKPLGESYADVRGRYDRRIERFYATIAASGRVLLVYHTKTQRLNEALVVEASARLRAKLGDHVDLLVIESVPGMEADVRREPCSGAVYWQGWFYKPEMHPVWGDRSLCDRVYGAIRSRGKTRVLLRRCWLRFRAGCHFTRQGRKQARQRLLGGANA